MKAALGIINWAARALLAAVYLTAAAAKFFDLTAFAGILGSYTILPKALAGITAFYIPTLEFSAAMLLLWPKHYGRGTLLSAFLATMFVTFFSWMLFEGKHVECGCFGRLFSTPSPVEGLLRAAAMLVLSGIIYGFSIVEAFRRADRANLGVGYRN